MIYFITAREVGRVKIGYSAEPRQRFMNMRTGSPVALELERICEGCLADEKQLHERFAICRINLEWFALSPDLEAYMATLPRPPMREKSLTGQLSEALNMARGYASMIANGQREITLPIALAFYAATGKRIGALSNAEPHEITILAKFVEPWVAPADRVQAA